MNARRWIALCGLAIAVSLAFAFHKPEQRTAESPSWLRDEEDEDEAQIQAILDAIRTSAERKRLEEQHRARRNNEGASTPSPELGSGGSRARTLDTFYIEVSHDDEFFIINGEKFEAKSYCYGMDEGDEVIFLDGSPTGACASATLLNLSTDERCDVWCE
jgi:hypothetical protein